MQLILESKADLEKMRKIATRFCSGTLDVASNVQRVTKDGPGSGRTKQIIPEDFKKVLRQASDSWSTENT